MTHRSVNESINSLLQKVIKVRQTVLNGLCIKLCPKAQSNANVGPMLYYKPRIS